MSLPSPLSPPALMPSLTWSALPLLSLIGPHFPTPSPVSVAVRRRAGAQPMTQMTSVRASWARRTMAYPAASSLTTLRSFTGSTRATTTRISGSASVSSTTATTPSTPPGATTLALTARAG